MDSTETPQQHIGPYRVGERLGGGGMGEVFEGFDERLERPVALKRIHPQSDDEALRKRFRREAKAVARLSHSSIVQIHDWVEDGSGAWIVMERVKGQSLRHLMRVGIDFEIALRLALDIAAGLGAAHQAGIVHRDLKPENVWVTDKGRAKILDFGLAKRELPNDPETSLTLDGKIVGTVTAMSPEQALGRVVGSRSDLFSFGSLLYEMVTGVSPFQADSTVATLTKICTQSQVPAIEVSPSVPQILSELIDRLLTKDPSLRPEDAAEVESALEMLAFNIGTRPNTAHGSGNELIIPAQTFDSVDSAETKHSTLFGVGSSPGTGVEDRGGQLSPSGQAESSASSVGAGPSSGAQLSGAHSSEGQSSARRWDPWQIAFVCSLLLVAAGLGSRWIDPESSITSSEDTGTTVSPRLSESVLQQSGGVNLETMESYQLYGHGMALLERYDKKGHIDRAIEAFQRLLEHEPDSAPAHAGLARAYWRFSMSESKDKDWLTKAQPVAERAVDLGPFLAAARVSRGLVYQDLGRYDEAHEDLEKALELEPSSVAAHIALAKLLQAEGDLEGAEEILLLGREQTPEAWDLHLLLGSLYYRTGRYEAAQSAFEQTIALAPDSTLGYRNLSAAHYALGDLGQASKFLQRALELEPKPTLYSNLGTIYFSQGLYVQAVSAFERAIELGGGSNDHRAWGNLADAYRWSPGKEEKAREAYRRAVQLLDEKLVSNPEEASLSSRRALYLAKTGDCRGAREAGEDLDKVSEKDASALYRLTVALEACSFRERALGALAKALQAGFSQDVIRGDPELRGLREDPNYHRLLANL